MWGSDKQRWGQRMPLNLHRPKSYWKFSVLVICLICGISLSWYTYRGRVVYPTLATIAWLAVFIVLAKTGIIEFQNNIARQQVVGTWASLSDFAKGAACMLGGVGWGILALTFTSDTVIGLAIVLIPFFALILFGGFLLARGFFRSLQ